MNTPGSFECECFEGYESGFMMMKNCMGKDLSPGQGSILLFCHGEESSWRQRASGQAALSASLCLAPCLSVSLFPGVKPNLVIVLGEAVGVPVLQREQPLLSPGQRVFRFALIAKLKGGRWGEGNCV